MTRQFCARAEGDIKIGRQEPHFLTLLWGPSTSESYDAWCSCQFVLVSSFCGYVALSGLQSGSKLMQFACVRLPSKLQNRAGSTLTWNKWLMMLFKSLARPSLSANWGV